MKNNHPLIRYGLAVVLVNQYEGQYTNDAPSNESIIRELKKGLAHFRLAPAEDIYTHKAIRYKYVQQKKADAKNNIYLAPNIIVQDKPAGNTYAAIEKIIKGLKEKPSGKTNVTMSIAPMAGDYLVFGATDARKGGGKMTMREAALSLISSTTIDKPCLAYKSLEKGVTKRTNVGIIPDLSLEELIQFVKLAKDLRTYSTQGRSLFKGKVNVEIDKKGVEKRRYPFRPAIYDGNFPYAPIASHLSKTALLASISEVVKETKFREANSNWPLIKKMIQSFSKCTFYLFRYGDAETFTYDHAIIDLAFKSNLYSIVLGLYHSKLFQYPSRRKEGQEEYAKFDFFTGRFLQLFNDSAFRDFFAFRCEYQPTVMPLFNTYFMKKKNIDPALVESASALGAWINNKAYWLAKADTRSTDSVYERKAKILATIESTIMSASTGSDIAVRAIRDISQHSNSDAPKESSLFIKAVIAGEIDKHLARNLILAFSRISTRSKPDENDSDENTTKNDDLILDRED